MKQNRIALYGGSFDPVHTGHIQIARTVLTQLNFDRVVFIPAAVSPLKPESMRADRDARLEMLRLATANEPAFQVDRQEIDRSDISYTIDTVRSFQAQYPKAKLFWILGSDQRNILPRWRSIEALVKLVTFIVFERPGSPLNPIHIPGLKQIKIEAGLMEQNSSEIRKRLDRGATIPRNWLPSPVQAFISEHQLYVR